MRKARGEDIPLPNSTTEVRQSTAQQSVSGQGNRGTLTFRNRGITSIGIPLDDITREQVNIHLLQEELQEIARPYVQLFTFKLPEVKGWPPIFRAKDEVVWTDEEETNDLKMRYEYHLNYLRTRKANMPQSFTLWLRSQHDRGRGWGSNPSPRITGTFSEEGLHDISLSWDQAHPDALLKLTSNSTLGHFLKESFVFGNDDQDRSRLRVEFDPNPEISLTQQFGQFINAKIRGIYVSSTYKFMGAENVFTRYFDNEDLHRSIGVSTQHQLTTVEFMEIVKDLFLLIPTIDLDQQIKSLNS